MSTLTEIEAAVMSLPVGEQLELFQLLADRLGRRAPVRTRRGLKAATRPALEGLPADLSVGTRERVRTLIVARHAAGR